MQDFLNWQSNLSALTVFAGSPPISYPEIWGDGVLYLSTLKNEDGRVVIMHLLDDVASCITPKSFSLGSKFSEYGGKPYWLKANKLYFVNQLDQCLYCQQLSDSEVNEPIRVSPKPTNEATFMYADVVLNKENNLICIIEKADKSSGNDRENTSFIASVDCLKPNEQPTILIEGADFYSNLCVDNDRNKIAWVQWNHPNMPWDETELWIADIVKGSDHLKIINQREIYLDSAASVCQLLFSNNGKLFFSADFKNQEPSSAKNYWNIYTVDPALEDSDVIAVTKERLEFGYPHWQYGDSRIVQFDQNTILTFASSEISDVLFKIDQDSLDIEIFGAEMVNYQNLSSDGNAQAVTIMLSENAKPSIATLKSNDALFSNLTSVINEIDNKEISFAEHIEFPTTDGKHAFGFYYPPVNSEYFTATDRDEFPPLIVMVHGGPTAKAYGNFDIQKQFWTQRGFAIFDLNHRGSSGYGRQYRDALYGEWGNLDTQDIVDGINYLAEAGKVDAKRVCIRGKSAGGYAVLRALTEYPDIFHAGACYYGIGNLVTLAETTHKFEKYYADRMIGESFDKARASKSESRFQTRSPINKSSQIRSAMIVFQGLKDKIVPPEVAHELIEVLNNLGLSHSYVEYADEGHGFKQVNNNVDALTKELKFYRTSLAKLNELN